MGLIHKNYHTDYSQSKAQSRSPVSILEPKGLQRARVGIIGTKYQLSNVTWKQKRKWLLDPETKVKTDVKLNEIQWVLNSDT